MFLNESDFCYFSSRIKQFEFEKKGFTFEIPKVLCLSDCAIRVLFTKFDHLSPQCRTNLSRQKRKVEGKYFALESILFKQKARKYQKLKSVKKNIWKIEQLYVFNLTVSTKRLYNYQRP